MGDGTPAVVRFRPRVWKAIQASLNDGEKPLFYLRGMNSQALVALDHRVVIVKAGWQAGVPFGTKSASFEYRDILGIEIRTQMAGAAIEILTASMPTDRKKAADFLEASNCFPFAARDLPKMQPYLQQLRERISGSREAIAP